MSPVTPEEIKFIEYKMNRVSLFRKSLYETYFIADDDNKKKLELAYPELEVPRRYLDEKGYWDDLIIRYDSQFF